MTVIKNWVDDFALLVEECQQTAEDSEGLEQLDLALSTFDGVCMKYQDKFCGERETAISAIQLALEACSVESEEKEKDERGVETRTRDIFLDVCTVDCKTALRVFFGGILDMVHGTTRSLRRMCNLACGSRYDLTSEVRTALLCEARRRARLLLRRATRLGNADHAAGRVPAPACRRDVRDQDLRQVCASCAAVAGVHSSPSWLLCIRCVPGRAILLSASVGPLRSPIARHRRGMPVHVWRSRRFGLLRIRIRLVMELRSV